MTTGTPEITPAPAPASWTTGLEADVVGHAANRGWDKLTPDKVAAEAVKAHMNAERIIGVPAEQVVRLPKKEDLAGWQGVYERLGAPKTAAEYKFDGVKWKDGTALDDKFTASLRAAAWKAHATQDGAVDIARAMIETIEADETSDTTTRQGELLVEKSKLRDSWGKNYDAFEVVAKRTAEVLGVTADQIGKLEGIVGYSGVMQMFYNIGTKIGEDSFIRNLPGGGGNGAMSKEQAGARKKSLMADPEWSKRYLSGGAEENKEMQALIRIERAE